MTARRERLLATAVMLGWAALYGGAVLLGRETRVPSSEFSLAWPAAAVSTVWLLSTQGLPRRALALAALVGVNALVNPLSDGSVVTGLLFGGVNALHAGACVAVLAAFGWRTARPPHELRDIGALAAASVSGAVAGAIVGGLLTVARLDGSFVDGMVLIGARNAVSTFVGVVTLLAIPRLHRSGGPAAAGERAVLVTLALVATLAVTAQSMPVLFLLVPLTVAVAVRCGPHVASVIAGLQGLVVVVETVGGRGPFAEIENVEVRVLLAQVLIVVLVLVGLVLSLEEQERSRALERSREAEARLLDLALHDQLTGLPNRALVGDRLEVALAEARRTGVKLAVLYVDVDRFKLVNDTRGHDGGDRVLQHFGGRLSALARAHDTVARLGGDEFVVLCPSVDSVAQAQGIAGRIVERMAEPFEIDGEPVVVTASVGVTIADGHDGDVREVLRRADTALYAAKDHGRSRYEVFNAETHAEAEQAAQLLDELRHAFDAGEMVMHYQPIVALADRRAVGLEALVRWQHPTRGVLAARDFLAVVEASELVFRLGDLALRQACRDGAALVAAGHELTVHVNVSPRELERPGTVENVRAVLDETGFPAELLTLEVTETRMLTVSGSLLRDLAALRRLGVRIAVDDFGTGYSGPAHLVQMPVDVLKLDRSFVAGVEDQRSARAVSSGVLAMARGLGVGLIAEGIETEAQEAALVALGYELGQGFLYGAAMPLDKAADWLRTHAAA